MKLKQVCSLSADYGLNISAESYVDGGVPMIRTSDFDDMGRLALSEAKAVSLFDARDKLLEKGDVLFSRSGTVGRCMVFEETKPCTFAAYLVRFRPRLTQAHPKFIFYWAQSKSFRHQVSVETIESTIGNFNGAKFASLGFPQLFVGDQKAIADFLDRETARIDGLIEKKEHFVNLLDEKEFALVSHLLTTGPASNVATKPARASWLEKIPAHWTWARMKDVCSQIIDCKNRTPPEVDEGKFLVVRTSCIRSGRFNIDGGYRTDEVSFSNWTKRGRPQPGDVLFTREAPMGEACLAPEELDFCLGQRMMIYRPNPQKIDARFIVRTIYSAIGKSYIEAKGKGSTVGHLRVPEVYDFPCLLPPIDEQRAVLAELDTRVGAYDTLRAATRKSVETLREHRSALITAAVTGQIDVATWGKRGTTDRRLDAIETDMAAAAQPERQQARA